MSQNMEAAIAHSWEYHMRCGNFAAAWECSDADLKARAGKPCWHLPRHYQYIWNGNSLQGKRVLIRCYHGLGDTIQFIRFAPMVKRVAKEVIVWAQPKLIPLLETMEGIDQLLPLHDGTPEVEYDVDVETMELPYIFRTTLETLPAAVPYLQVEPLYIFPKNNRFTVGLVWRGGDWDERRNIPFSALLPLANIPNIQFTILQADAAAAGWQEGFGMNASNYSFMEHARIIKGLDLLISVDSMPAHLAGALGVPVWNLLQKKADWRWMDDRADSPWYPTMRLFRQEKEGDWEGVIKRVAGDLEKWNKTTK
ncbi:glycosyltransferase family 9 protein [Ilyomonas limi]|uniref:Glycosyltransferase family 9 protein n=1 Tax=Ilyomonas limi TaxID=2575867 RepID=A0A4U3L931_9BACT|nr:glycosyltransferase family 9 protein [Ilyomonas limi]TKK71831.1 glycosyltransferase family 9 protein [Ilyomonas limi]